MSQSWTLAVHTVSVTQDLHCCCYQATNNLLQGLTLSAHLTCMDDLVMHLSWLILEAVSKTLAGLKRIGYSKSSCLLNHTSCFTDQEYSTGKTLIKTVLSCNVCRARVESFLMFVTHWRQDFLIYMIIETSIHGTPIKFGIEQKSHKTPLSIYARA